MQIQLGRRAIVVRKRGRRRDPVLLVRGTDADGIIVMTTKMRLRN